MLYFLSGIIYVVYYFWSGLSHHEVGEYAEKFLDVSSVHFVRVLRLAGLSLHASIQVCAYLHDHVNYCYVQKCLPLHDMVGYVHCVMLKQ